MSAVVLPHRAWLLEQIEAALEEGGFTSPAQWPALVVVLRPDSRRAGYRAKIAAELAAAGQGRIAQELKWRKGRAGHVVVLTDHPQGDGPKLVDVDVLHERRVRDRVKP